MKTLPLLFSILCTIGCSQDDTTPTEPVEPIDAQVDPEPEPEPEVDPMTEAMGLVERGELADAMAAVEALLGEHADDMSLWYALELCAIGSGQPGELLDRLSVTEAIGGKDAAHHTLRATLATAAERHADTKDAAIALKAYEPGSSATFLALALRAGAEVPTDNLDAEQPTDALLMAAAEANPKKRIELLTKAAEVQGWRAAMLRAQLLLELEDEEQHDAILAELATVAGDEDPRAPLAALDLQLDLVEDPAQASELILAAADKAMAAHNTVAATDLRAQAVDLLMRDGQADRALELARAHLSALPEDPSPVRAQATVFTLHPIIATGEYQEALELATGALNTEDPGPTDEALARSITRAGWRVCDLTALETAAKVLPAPQANVAEGMAGLCQGDVSTARDKLGTGTSPGALGVDARLAQAWAWFDDEASTQGALAAVEAANELGWTTARIEAGLALERHARVTYQVDLAAQAIQALEADASPALQAELYARRALLGLDPGSLPTLDEEPELVTAWRGLAQPAAPGEEPSTGIAAWFDAHHALAAGAAGEAKQAFDRAMPNVPVRRQARWSPLLALDGGDGPTLESDVQASIGLTGKGGEDPLLALHEFSHFRDFQRMAASVGYDWSLGMKAEDRTAFAEAHGREAARTLLWLAGTGSFPTEARAATTAAITDDACFANMAAPLDVAGVRTQYAETALFSIRLGAASGEMLLITPSTTKVKRFDRPERLRDWVQGYLDALGRGRAFGGGATDPTAGDRFRREVIDGVVGELVGIARYLVVADPDLLRLPWAVLPEQIEGRRYLADIRTVSSLPYLGPQRIEATPPEGGYKPDYLGLSREVMATLEEMTQEELAITDDVTRTMLEAGLKPQGETSSIARLFGGGYSIVKLGAEATVGALEEKETGYKGSRYQTARYIHLSGIPATPSGGFEWADGETVLPELACSEMSAKLVVISTGPSPEVQLVRAQALREAGAAGVLVAMWNPPPILRSRYLTSVYDALNRERAPARALAEARETLVNTLGADGGQADPSYWGAFLYVGAP